MPWIGGVIKIYVTNVSNVQTQNQSGQNSQTQTAAQKPLVVININEPDNNQPVIIDINLGKVRHHHHHRVSREHHAQNNTAAVENNQKETEKTAAKNNTQEVNKTKTEYTYKKPSVFFVSTAKTEETNRKVSVNDWLKENIASLGAIKADNPVKYAILKAREDKNFVDALINAVKTKLHTLHVYERVNKAQNLYQYSVNANGQNLNLNEWFEINREILHYGLNLQTKEYEIHEWINLNKETQNVNYGFQVETPKLRAAEWFNGTPANYSYSLDINRQPNETKFQTPHSKRPLFV